MGVLIKAPAGARAMCDHGASVTLFCASAVITAYLGFQQGGFFPGSIAIMTIALAICLIVRVVVVHYPFEGLGWRALLGITGLAVLAALTLLSSTWSHAPGRAVIEFNRVLLYLVVFLLSASSARDDRSFAALAAGFALGSIVLCGAGFLTRTLPALFPIAPSQNSGRLGYPLSYRNALGLTAVLGILMCLGLSAAERLPRAIRLVAAGAVPLFAATLLLTFSRGAMAAGLVALVILWLTSRTRSTSAALLACALGSVPAVAASYSATALAQSHPTGPTTVSQGRQLVLIVALSCLAAAALRFVLARWEGPRQPRHRLGARQRRVLLVLSLLVTFGGASASAIAFDLPHQLSRQYHQFVVGVRLPANVPLRDRLLNVGNNGRLPLWRVAVSAWRSEPFTGHGAGTYQELWDRYRPRTYAIDVVNAHSLYLEVMAELGIVGLVALVASLLAILLALVRRMRSADRALLAGLVAAVACWLVHAGVDWDWQMPANSWWLFAAGGLCLSHERRPVPGGVRLGQWRRLLVAVAIGAGALLPVQVELSQTHLTRAVTGLRRGNCRVAVDQALQSVSDLSARAEPYEILGYCDARYGLRSLSLTMIQSAINRDPEDWEYRYDMALVRGIGGLDPRAAAATAVALNPLSPLTTGLASAVRSSSRRVWQAQTLKAHLLIP